LHLRLVKVLSVKFTVAPVVRVFNRTLATLRSDRKAPQDLLGRDVRSRTLSAVTHFTFLIIFGCATIEKAIATIKRRPRFNEGVRGLQCAQPCERHLHHTTKTPALGMLGGACPADMNSKSAG
jgi:hypothetical protein